MGHLVRVKLDQREVKLHEKLLFYMDVGGKMIMMYLVNILNC